TAPTTPVRAATINAALQRATMVASSEIAAIKAHPKARTAIAPPTVTSAALRPALPASSRTSTLARRISDRTICWTLPTMYFRTVPIARPLSSAILRPSIPLQQPAGHEADDGGAHEGLGRMRLDVTGEVRHDVAHRVVSHVVGCSAQRVGGLMGELAHRGRQLVRVGVECRCGA